VQYKITIVQCKLTICSVKTYNLFSKKSQSKDSFQLGNPAEVEFSVNKPSLSAENPSFQPRNSQSKVKESKLNKTKGEEGRNTTTNCSVKTYNVLRKITDRFLAC